MIDVFEPLIYLIVSAWGDLPAEALKSSFPSSATFAL